MFEIEYGRTRTWIAIALGVLLLIVGYLVVSWLVAPALEFRGAAPDQPEVPLIAPVAQPTIAKFDEIAQYTEGKPLPAEPNANVYLGSTDADKHVRGDPATRVTMVEYAGLASTYTQVIHEELITFLEHNKDRMHWVFRHYPKTKNENDYRSSSAAECLYAQLGDAIFWRYVDALLYNIGSTLPIDLLVAEGGKLGADESALRACIEGKEYMDDILGDKGKAQVESKIFVAPAFVFHNRRTGALRIVEGINTIDYMQAVLDDLTREPAPPPEEEVTY